MNQEKAQELYDKVLQEEVHLSVITDVLIGRIEHLFYYSNNLIVLADIRSKEIQQLGKRIELLERHLRLCKMYTGAIKSFIDRTFNQDDHYKAMMGISKQFDQMFNMHPDQISLVHVAIAMIKKGCLPTYIDLNMLQKQEIAKRTNLPVEYISQVIAHIPDVLLKEDVNSVKS
jgi:hypothetical protein